MQFEITALADKWRDNMATVDELIKQYDTDEKLKAEVDEILADNKITFIP